MATTELKTLEKLIKEILEKVKKIGAQKQKEDCGSAFDKINTKLDTIDERLAAPKTTDNISAELISKVDEINTKIDQKSEDYVKEIQLAFDKYCVAQKELMENPEVQGNPDIKDFVSIITNEIMELKESFEKFNTEFNDIGINTSMAMSKEIVSLRNYVLSLNDSVDNIKQKIDNFNAEDEIAVPVVKGINDSVANTVNEVFNTALTNFKNDVFGLIAKISEGIQGISNQISEGFQGVSKQISDVSANLKTFEGLEISVGEIIENQQKNKSEILKIIQKDIEEENKKLIPQIMQIVDSISFDESAEEIKDGLYAVNENLGIVNKNIETGSKCTEQIFGKIEDINNTINTDLKDAKQVFEQINNISENIKETSDEISGILKNNLTEKITRIDDTIEQSDLVKKLLKIDSTLESVSNEFNVLTKGSKEETGEYLYSLLDLESDISKVRVILDELNHSLKDDRSLAESVTKNISDKIANLNSFVEQTANLYASPDYKELLIQFDSLNDDITSISKRTNKLILTSDDASEKLQKNIADFQEILSKICTSVKTFENSGVLKALNIRTENIQKLLLNSAQSDKAVNEAFVYLANWIDSTSEQIQKLEESISELKSQNNEIREILKPDEETDTKALEKLIKDANKKLTDNTKKMDLLEQKLNNLEDASALKSMLEFVVAQVQVLNEKVSANKNLEKKIDKMEKQIQQLLSYVEEDE